MKTKPVIITLSVVAVAIAIFFVVRGRHTQGPGKEGVMKFLEAFDRNAKAGNTDSLADFFEVKQNTAVLQHLINVLANKSGVQEGRSPLFNLVLDVDQSQVKTINSENTQATIPVRFANDSVPTMHTAIKFRVHKTTGNTYKISQVDANKMMADYLAYNTRVKGKTLTDKDIYAEVTLKAFETAKQLKAKYDTVIWFAHDQDKTYYYVVKGYWDELLDIFDYRRDTTAGPYKMGLVGPDLKEIIPVEYDLIYNISGTFPGLVEVEKDKKRGFYDLNGKIAIPVNYDQVFPLNDDENLAVLRSGDNYSYLKKDMTISEKADIQMADFFPKIKMINGSVTLTASSMPMITEYNSRDMHGSVFITPSYLADLNMIGKLENFKNPLRRSVFEEVHTNYLIGAANEVKTDENWLSASFYSIRDYFVGGRSEFYDKKNIVILDKKRNRIYTRDIGTDYTREETSGESLTGPCNVNSIRALNDSLYEIRSGAIMYLDLYDPTKTITGGVYYHYMVVKGNELVELKNERNFGFTKYVKMDDSYLNACYMMMTGDTYKDSKQKNIDHITPEMLRYMKNEIYADYGYQFKDKRWEQVFQNMPAYGYDANGNPKPGLANVNDSLTDIDKYNINWINQKLNPGKSKSNTLAAK